ncbi:MAG TPA: GspMb/PilO family protein [Vicinamibacterales bacterium]|nr:GspMb/PilO family protein [Vicinamibacterales bacterium]
MTPLGRRVLDEKRSVLVALAAAIVVNIGVYAFAVHPLGVRSASAAERARAAAESVRLAQKDYDAARALITGKSRADQELTTFYHEVVPPDEPTARRITYTPVVEIARKANVKFLSRNTEDDLKEAKKTGLGRLYTRIVFQCDYPSFRTFIYELESASAFMIIDDVVLAQTDPAKPLTLTVVLSTYFRASGDGT